MSRVSKKEDMFYRMLSEQSQKLVEASDVYVDIIQNYPDSAGSIPQMKRIETEADTLVHDILVKLYESFITPFDREDIYNLTQHMDDVVDNEEHIVRRLSLYHVKNMAPEATELAVLTQQATQELKVLFDHLPYFKKDSAVMEQVQKVHTIEDRGDDVYHDAIGRLYDEKDATPTHLLKWNTLFNRMEDTLDACKAVSSIVSNVVLKNA
ncbi:MAG: DUF47 family protein [Coriobacteriales bacterium]|nr:DUF47 family protein [Coriobacteriales bacterium]